MNRKIITILAIVGLLVSLVSAGGYAPPPEEWRPATLAEADALNVVGHLNRAIVHLTGLYVGAGVYVAPIINKGGPVYVEEPLSYGGCTYQRDENEPVSDWCLGIRR